MSSDGGEWFIRVRGRIKGPFDMETLQGLKARGQLGRMHEVSEDCRTWSPAASITELFQKPPARPVGNADAASQPAETAAVEEFAAEGVDADWYYVDNGQRIGPAPIGELKQLLLSGQLPADALVWRTGQADWYPASDVPELGAANPQANVRVASPLRRFRWVIGGVAAVSVLLLVGVAAVLFNSGVVSDSHIIQTVESADSPKIIGQAVGLVVSGWRYRGADRKTNEGTFILGAPFDGPFKKKSKGGYVLITSKEKDVLPTKGLFRKERKGNIFIYHKLEKEAELCLVQQGACQLVHKLGSTGTCFTITPDGYALTNKHVIEDAHEFQQSQTLLDDMRELDDYNEILEPTVWVFFDGQQYEAAVVYVSDDFDFALLKISEKEDSSYFALGATITETVAPRGSKVYALGYPGAARVAINEKERVARAVQKELGNRIKDNFSFNDFDYSQNDGSISRVGKRDVGMLIQHNADINPGNSGGPLVNKDGLVYGINTWTNTNASGIHFSLAIDQLRKEIERHITSGTKPVWK